MGDIMIDKFKKYYLCFMMYAIIGWLYEFFLEVVVYRWGFSNRGVLFGPYCPVYGVGALTFIFTIGRLLKNKSLKQKIILIPIIFLGCMGIATLIELFASYICEFLFGSWPWQTYSDYKYNFQARIALSPSIRFGLGGILFLYIIQPIYDKFYNKLSKKMINVIFNFVFIIFIIDIISLIIFKFIV